MAPEVKGLDLNMGDIICVDLTPWLCMWAVCLDFVASWWVYVNFTANITSTYFREIALRFDFLTGKYIQKETTSYIGDAVYYRNHCIRLFYIYSLSNVIKKTVKTCLKQWC